MGGDAACRGDGEDGFNVVGADVGHGFGEPCAIDFMRHFLLHFAVG